MTPITKDQSRDTGMAMVLLLLILHVTLDVPSLAAGALALQVVTMTVPRVFAPVAVVWLGLSHLLGAVMSKVPLSIVFLLIVTPVGLVRRVLGKDPMKVKAFKTGDASVMVRRDHAFSARDLEKPY